MYCVRKVNEDYTWVGADGRRLPMFEGVYDVPKGVSFNSYLLSDEKTVLFDTADAAAMPSARTSPTRWAAARSTIWSSTTWSPTTPPRSRR